MDTLKYPIHDLLIESSGEKYNVSELVLRRIGRADKVAGVVLF